SHVPDAEAGALRCLTALGSPRLTWWMSAVASSRAGVGPAGPTSNWVRRQGGTHGDVPLGQRAEALGHPAGGRGRLRRTLARLGWDVKVAAAAGGDSRPALAPRMASATGWSTTVVSAVTAPTAAGAASRSLPGRPGGRRPARDVMRALVVAERSGKVRRIRRLPV